MAFNLSSLKPVKLSEEQSQMVTKAVEKQDLSKRAIKSLDEENFPLWETLVNDKALIYIPNFTTTNPETGKIELNIESAFIYNIHFSHRYMDVRSTQGLAGLEEMGISGSDPLEEAVQVNWELYNEKLAIKAAELGLDARSDDTTIKSYRRTLLDNFTVRPASEYYYFPIIHIETEKDENGVHNPRAILQRDGKIVAKPYFYRISKNQFEKQFLPIIDTLEEGQTLGGQFYIFSYITGKKTEELSNPKRDSGLAFTPTLSPMSSFTEDKRKQLDALATDFTREKLREVIVSCLLLTDEQHAEIAKEAKLPVKAELETLSLMSAGASLSSTVVTQTEATPEEVLGNFGQEKEEAKMIDIKDNDIPF